MRIKQYYSVAEVAKMCQVTSYSVRRWIRIGKLKGELIAGSKRLGYRIKREDFEKFQEENPNHDITDKELDRIRASIVMTDICVKMRKKFEKDKNDHGKVWNEAYEQALKDFEFAVQTCS